MLQYHHKYFVKNILDRMILEKLVDGKAVPEEEMDLLLDLVGPEVMVDQ